MVEASRTCLFLTTSRPHVYSKIGFDAIPDFAKFNVIREYQDFEDIREVEKLDDFCEGKTEVSLGEINHQEITVLVAYDPDDEAAIKADSQFEKNELVYVKRVLSDGATKYYETSVSERTEAYLYGSQVAREYIFQVDKVCYYPATVETFVEWYTKNWSCNE